MSIAKYRRVALGALMFAVLAVGCGDDTVLGAPDVASCTAGTLKAGDTKSGAISESSCMLWHDYNYGLFLSESWTLRTNANTAYIVRLIPTEDSEGENTFNGELSVFSRNAAGDFEYATGYWGNYGPANSTGGQSVELILPSAEPTTVSLRAYAYDETTTGSYDIEIIACPMRKLTVGAPAIEQEFEDEGCALLSDGAQLPTAAPVRFWTFEGDVGTSYTTTITRVAGTSNLRGRLRGANLDYGCYTNLCIGSSTATGTGPSTIVRTPLLTGSYTVAVLQQSAGTLTASVGVVQTPSIQATSSTQQR